MTANRNLIESIHRARAEKNWEALIEIGKNLLNSQEYESAVECFIEARHLNKEEPITHKHLADAYLAMSEQGSLDETVKKKCLEKARTCYQDALQQAETIKDEHFLAEFSEEIIRKI